MEAQGRQRRNHAVDVAARAGESRLSKPPGLPESASLASAIELLRGITSPAVYFLVCDADVVYVGQTKNFRARVRCHAKRLEFDRVYWLAVAADQLLSQERYWIRKLHPPLNRAFPRPPSKTPKRDRPGRPALPPDERLAVELRSALTAAEADAVKAAAERAGLSVSAWSRRVLVRAAKRAQ